MTAVTLPLGVLLLFLTCVPMFFTPGSPVGISTQDCYSGDKIYSQRSRWKADDGCNTCFCRNGRIICTLNDCAPPKSGCHSRIDGRFRQSGSAYMVNDGCDMCICFNGREFCTERRCDSTDN
ncbi:von Willebrand factor C and EGF domain-containing protein-like [Ptychodera flava]|uniref:von Willebrand factor C and EGF domain-containing protein-like n=1 Tax=Ptychodera flava TaxID=63121 RepID=UPI003969F5F5